MLKSSTRACLAALYTAHRWIDTLSAKTGIRNQQRRRNSCNADPMFVSQAAALNAVMPQQRYALLVRLAVSMAWFIALRTLRRCLLVMVRAFAASSLRYRNAWGPATLSRWLQLHMLLPETKLSSGIHATYITDELVPKLEVGTIRCLAEGGVAWLPDAPRKWWPWHSDLLSHLTVQLRPGRLPFASQFVLGSRQMVVFGLVARCQLGHRHVVPLTRSVAGLALFSSTYALPSWHSLKITTEGLSETVSLSWSLLTQKRSC